MMDVNEMGRSWSEEQTLFWLYLRILKWAVVAVSVVLLLDFVVAHAEDAVPAKKVPEFVPIMVDRVQYEAVMDHLNGLPFKTALPLVKWLGELEDRAKAQWAADNAPKEVPKP